MQNSSDGHGNPEGMLACLVLPQAAGGFTVEARDASQQESNVDIEVLPFGECPSSVQVGKWPTSPSRWVLGLDLRLQV